MSPGLPRSLAVLGGTGFFGKSFLDAFHRGLLSPWGIGRVIAVARHPEVLRATDPDLVGPSVELIQLDVAETTRLPRADIVVHAANTANAERYATDPMGERAAILAAAHAFAARASEDCPEAGIVYVSSGAVYGAQPADVMHLAEEAPFADAASLAPYKRDYAEAKRLAEAAIAAMAKERGIRAAIARCFAFIGPYLPRDRHFAVGNFLADGIAGRPVRVTARRPVIRSYMYSDDLVRWLMTIADHASPDCQVYNVGSDAAVDVTDVARRVAARYGVAVTVPPATATPIDRYVPSVQRAARDLKLSCQMDLDQSIAATVAWLRRHAADPNPEFRVAATGRA